MEEIKCYICGATFKNKGSLTRHIKTSKEIEHVKYRQHIENMKNSFADSLDYKLISCKRCACHECDINIQALCLREENKIYKEVKKRADKEEKRKQRLEVHANEARRKQLHKDDPDTPNNLLRFFYNLTDNVCVNYGMELSKIKRLLSYGVTPDCIRFAFKIMISRGEKDLRYFGKYAIQEAVKVKKCLDEIEVEDSLPFLVKKYYDKTNTQFSTQILVQGVERLNRLKHEYKLDKDKLKYVVDYMINNQVTNFNFINNRIVEALRELNEAHARREKEQEQFSENHYLQSAIDDIINGNTTVDEIMQIYGKNFTKDMSFPQKVCSILEEDKYNNKFSAMEWAYKINFHFNKRTYFVAKKHTYRATKFTGNEKNNYINWLREQKNRFEG